MPTAGHGDTHSPEALGHPAPTLLLDLSTLAMVSPTASTVPLAAPGSVGSAAHAGLFIVGSRGAGAPWQRCSPCQSWHQDRHLHGDPVHILWGSRCIYLFASLFSLVVIKQTAPGIAASLFCSAAGHGSSGEGCWLLGRAGVCSLGCSPGPAAVRVVWQSGTSALVSRARGRHFTWCSLGMSTVAVVSRSPRGHPGGSSLGASKVSVSYSPPVQLGSPVAGR